MLLINIRPQSVEVSADGSWEVEVALILIEKKAIWGIMVLEFGITVPFSCCILVPAKKKTMGFAGTLLLG